ncbi:nucleotidyltransferase domain-containing protein [Hydrogenophilus islandicus]
MAYPNRREETRIQVRLDQKTVAIIKTEITQRLGDNVTIRLFGSRADDAQRGGDIDLLIETPHPIPHRIVMECKIAAALFIKLGGRKVDVLIKDPTMPIQPIYKMAYSQGVVL